MVGMCEVWATTAGIAHLQEVNRMKSALIFKSDVGEWVRILLLS